MKIYTESELKAMPVTEVMEKIGDQGIELAGNYFGGALKNILIRRYLTSQPKAETKKDAEVTAPNIDKPSTRDSHK